MYRDFLVEPEEPKVEGSGDLHPLAEGIAAQAEILSSIHRELLKQNPNVLAVTRVQGSSPILAPDVNDHRVFFEVGGKAVEVYSLVIYSTFSGSLAVSPNSMSKLNDGMILSAGDVLVLPITVDSMHVLTDGTADCPINNPSDDTDGALFIYGWTISEFENRKR